MIGIRSVAKDMTSCDGFKWPISGVVEATDFDPSPKCGGGLHFLRPGDNGPGQWYTGKYLAIDAEDVIDLGDKAKCRRAKVLFVAEDMEKLSKWLIEHGYNGPWYRGVVVVGDDRTAIAGYCGIATAGNGGTATAGNGGTATAGHDGRATAGYCGTATAGDCGRAIAGNHGTATAGYDGTAIAGDGGRAIAGNHGTATAGYDGTAIAGDGGKATAGDDGTATAGKRGTATAGKRGVLNIYYFSKGRLRLATAYVGENDILPNVTYRLDELNRFVEVKNV